MIFKNTQSNLRDSHKHKMTSGDLKQPQSYTKLQAETRRNNSTLKLHKNNHQEKQNEYKNKEIDCKKDTKKDTRWLYKKKDKMMKTSMRRKNNCKRKWNFYKLQKNNYKNIHDDRESNVSSRGHKTTANVRKK